MKKLPFLVSVPHAGLKLPKEVEPYFALTEQQIIDDSDEGAAEVYAIETDVSAFVTTDVARVIVDMNRSPTDRGPDGVVKTRTCSNVKVYHSALPEDMVGMLIDRYHSPYHRRLKELAPKAMFGVDCHTMASVGPPLGPDPGCERPAVCLSNGRGTCPHERFNCLASCLEKAFGLEVSLNKPFKGGHIICSHSGELPWVQIEFSRGFSLPHTEKRARLLQALQRFCDLVL